MKVLITGGTGLIGKALAVSLLAGGDHVWVLSRDPGKKRMAEQVVMAGWDGRSPHGWDHLANEMDVIVNLAGTNIGAQRWTTKRKQQIHESRIKAGEAITSAIRGASRPPKVLIQASAVGYYGTANDLILDEVSPPGNDFLSNVCKDWEASTAPVEAFGVRRVVIRTGIVLDRQEGPLARILLPFRLFVGGPLGNGRQWLPWIHLADEIGAIRFVIEEESARGVFNLTSPQPVTNAEFGRAVARVLHRPYWLPVPSAALKILLGEMSLLVLDGQHALPRRLMDMGYHFRFDGVEAALIDILNHNSKIKG